MTATADFGRRVVAPPRIGARDSGPAAGAAGTFRPVLVLEAELERGLRDVLDAVQHRGTKTAGTPRAALVLVRIHSHPLGLVALDLEADDPSSAWPIAVRSRVGAALDAHLGTDGLDGYDIWGGAPALQPACLAERRAALAAARPVTVIIATRERPARLARCLDSLLALEYPDFDVVVVDNDPETDESKRLVETRYVPTGRVRYVRETERGLGAAHNCGLKEARGEIVAFTDDDVLVDGHWLSELVIPFVADPNVGAATGLIVPAELETPAQVMLEAHGEFSKGFTPRSVDLAAHRPADPLFPFTPGRFGSGANMAFETAWLRGAGGFDPALGTGTTARGGDDLEALFRLVVSGRALAYRPGAVVWHHHHRDMSAVERQAHGYGVGLGAYLTSALFEEPRAALSMVTRLPAAVRHVRARTGAGSVASSELGAALGWTPSWPRALVRAEWRGIATGPFAYLKSRREHPRRIPFASAGGTRP